MNVGHSSGTVWNLSGTFTPLTSSARLGHHAHRKEGRLSERRQELPELPEHLVVTRRTSVCCSPSSSWRAHQAGRPRSASSPSPSQPWKEAILLDRRPVEFPLPEERGPRLACLHVVSVSALDRLVIISLTEALQKYPFNKEANDYLSYLTVKSPRRPKL